MRKIVLMIAFVVQGCVNREQCEVPMSSHCVGNVLHFCGSDRRSRPNMDCAAVQAGEEGERVVCCQSARTGRENCLPTRNCIAVNPTR